MAAITNALTCLHNTGLTIIALIQDLETTQRFVMFKKYGVTCDRPYFYHSVTDNKVFVIWDVSHLLKCTRNNFRNYNITSSLGTAK